MGKSDPLDARRIAEAALPLDENQLRHPRSDEGERAALRVLVTARDHMTGERTATVNALTALMRAIDLGHRRSSPTAQQGDIGLWQAVGVADQAAMAGAALRRL